MAGIWLDFKRQFYFHDRYVISLTDARDNDFIFPIKDILTNAEKC